MDKMTKRLRDARPAGDGAPAAATFAERAERAGLLDVAYASVDSPFGPLLAAATPRGLVRLAYPDEAPGSVLQDLAERVSPRVLESPGRMDTVRRALGEYFEGRRRDFGLRIDWVLTRGFTRRVLEETAGVGFGELVTYTEVAARAGSPRGSRAAGNALGSNPIPIVVPCHRVVRTGGALGGYTGGLDRKMLLLRLEGALPS